MMKSLNQLTHLPVHAGYGVIMHATPGGDSWQWVLGTLTLGNTSLRTTRVEPAPFTLKPIFHCDAKYLASRVGVVQ